MRVGIPIADLTAGLFCAIGILIALLERESSGEGQGVETSLLQAQIFMLDFQAARWLVKGEVAKQAGNNHPTSIPTGVFKTKDGYINIASAGQKIWERFCQTLGTPEWIAKPGLRDRRQPLQEPRRAQCRDRRAHRDAHQRRMGRAIQQGRRARAGRSTRSTRCSPIRRSSTSASPRRSRQERQRPTLVGQPVALSRTPSRIVAPPPALGEHTDECPRASSAFSADEIAKLRAADAI